MKHFIRVCAAFFLFASCSSNKMGYAPPGSDFEILSVTGPAGYDFLITVDSDNTDPDSIPVHVTAGRSDSLPISFLAFYTTLSACDSAGNNCVPLSCTHSGISLTGTSAFVTNNGAGQLDLSAIPATHDIRSAPDSAWNFFEVSFLFVNPEKEQPEFLYAEYTVVTQQDNTVDTLTQGFLVQWQWVREYGGSLRIPKLFCECHRADAQSQWQ